MQKEHEKDLAYLSFRVSPEFKREFKTFASAQGISMTELLEIAFQAAKAAKKADKQK
jgi:hypothetical protein